MPEVEVIRDATEADIPALVRIHRSALPEDLLASLGRSFLGQVFWPAVLGSSNAFTLVSEEEGLVNAFVVFAYDGLLLTEEILHDRFRIARYILLGLLRKPRIAAAIINHIRGFKVELDVPMPFAIVHLPELYLIAILSTERGRGIGSRIVAEGLKRLTGYPGCLVKTSSDRAKLFYCRNRFAEIGRELRGRRRMHILFYLTDESCSVQ